VNIWDDNWGEQPEDWSGGGGRSKRLVPGGGPLLGATLYELERGNLVVYHAHHGSEELLILLRGVVTLQTPEGERELEEGEVVHFPVGPDGAHGVRNDGDSPARYVMVSTLVSPEVAEYPELKQITAQARTHSQTGEPLFVIHDVAAAEE
jgi:uncharacterized cupin superfamily protein